MGDPADTLAASTFRIVGVIHLPPLPGSARGPSAREMNGILESVRRDAAAWASGGANALIVENFGDVPFRKGAVGPETVAAMTLAVVAGERRERTSGGGECASQRRGSGGRHCRACRRPVRPRQCLCRRRGDRSGA